MLGPCMSQTLRGINMQPGLKGVKPCWEYWLSRLVKTWLLGQASCGFAEFEVRPLEGVRSIVPQWKGMILQWFGSEWGGPKQ